MGDFILNFVPTGMIPTKAMTPEVPLTTAEIVDQVLEVAELGVNMVHLHARDPRSGAHTHVAEHYGEIIAGIRRHRSDLVIGVTTSGRNGETLAQRVEVLALAGEAKPDCASLTLGSINFNQRASVNGPETVVALLETMMARDIRPELEVFDLGMLNYARYLLDKALLRPPCYFNLILGGVAGAQATPGHLGTLLADLPARAIWAAGGLGQRQMPAIALGLASGGGARVGLEDNLWLDTARRRLASNKALVERVLVIADILGRRPMAASAARVRLGLSGR